MVDSIPADVLQQRVLYALDPESKLRAALTCSRWLRLLAAHLPALRRLHISLDGTACDATRIDFCGELDTSAEVCQCATHKHSLTALIRTLLAHCSESLQSVQIEDNLLNRCPEECIRDYPFHVILNQCSCENLRHISLHYVDLSSVRVWTLSALAKYSALTSVSFEECKFPAELNESLFLRMLSPSFGAIEVLRITGNSLITDKLGIQVAKRCYRLEELSLRGCGLVTAVTAVAFCEHLAKKVVADDDVDGQQRPLPVRIDLRGTAFDSNELARHLDNPLLQCAGSSWVVQPVSMEIGFERRALLLAERNLLGSIGMLLFVD